MELIYMTAEPGNTRRLGRLMVIAAWMLLAGLLTMVFSKVLERQHNPNQQVQINPRSDGFKEIVLGRNRLGHYVATGKINGIEVEFLLDTGATNIAIPQQVATKLRLNRGAPLMTYTANGIVRTYATTLDHVALGSISATGVTANINPHMGGNQVLLGMSFLKQFELLQCGDQLTIRSGASSGSDPP
jgi:aspartyl protease family protein